MFRKKSILITVLSILTIVIIYLKAKINDTESLTNVDYRNLYFDLLEKFKSIELRDFMRYKCQNRLRVGGESKFIKNAPDNLFRIDGAWFICLDKNLSPVKHKCNVLSFGINTDPSFDIDIIDKYACNVHSFDPNIEAEVFKNIRVSDPSLQDAAILRVNDKWKFYSIGISGDNQPADLNNIKKGNLLKLESILQLTNLENKVIDIFKIDVEGAEYDVFKNMNVDYACKFIKQFMFETHKNFKFNELNKFEKCFRLFHRDARLFMKDFVNFPTGTLTEFQNPDGFLLQIKNFQNELNLAEYLFVNGEFYFINLNFI